MFVVLTYAADIGLFYIGKEYMPSRLMELALRCSPSSPQRGNLSEDLESCFFMREKGWKDRRI